MSGVNTSSVTNMIKMFENNIRLERLDASNWDTSSVTNMANMFSNCVNLKELK